jgi:hypothetical protein
MEYKSILKGIMSITSICILLISGMLVATRALAQEPVEEGTPKSDCLVCHDDLYYQHDTGKSFCMCEESMTCTCCHGGNDQSVIEEEAHAGMSLHPITDDASVCQRCHTEDYEERAARFATIAGVSEPAPTMKAVDVLPVLDEPMPALFPSESEVWRYGLLGFVFVLFLLVAIFGYRCWQKDCLAKQVE